MLALDPGPGNPKVPASITSLFHGGGSAAHPMKTGIHPEYITCRVHCACGNEFQTRATKPEIKVDICSECHPFFTGEQRYVDTAGRVDKFRRRAALQADKADKAKKPADD